VILRPRPLIFSLLVKVSKQHRETHTFRRNHVAISFTWFQLHLRFSSCYFSHAFARFLQLRSSEGLLWQRSFGLGWIWGIFQERVFPELFEIANLSKRFPESDCSRYYWRLFNSILRITWLFVYKPEQQWTPYGGFLVFSCSVGTIPLFFSNFFVSSYLIVSCRHWWAFAYLFQQDTFN